MDKRRNYNRNAPKQRKETHITSKKKESKKRKIGHIDYTFLTLVIIIVCTGLVMLFSASAPAANRKFDNSYHFFIRQFYRNNIIYTLHTFSLFWLILNNNICSIVYTTNDYTICYII